MTRQILSSWVSWHLFYQGSRDRLLLDLVRPLAGRLWRDGWIDNFFFIRYALGGPHVRLRLRCRPGCRDTVGDLVQAAATDFFSRWPSESVLTEEEIRRTNQYLLTNDPYGEDRIYPNDSAVECPFHLETGRYGGEALVGHSLYLFTLSSVHVLSLLETHAGGHRGDLLSIALRTLASLSLALAWSGESFLELIRYAVVWSKGSASLIVRRGDEAFDQAPAAPCHLLRKAIGALKNQNPKPLLIEAAGGLTRLTRASDAPLRREIAVGHLHMTANRLGLGNPEEIYLGRLLWRAAEQIRSEDPHLWRGLNSALVAATTGGRQSLQSLRSLARKALDEFS